MNSLWVSKTPRVLFGVRFERSVQCEPSATTLVVTPAGAFAGFVNESAAHGSSEPLTK